MKETSDITAIVVDRGTFFPVAKRLAREYKKVYYHNPVAKASEEFFDGCLGAFHEDVELAPDFWLVKPECDLFIFPDCHLQDVGKQAELERQGLAVWGGKGSAVLEQMRGEWMKVCEVLDLPLPKTHKIKGLTNLSIFLHEHEGEIHYVKISRWRGDMETWEAKDIAKTRNKLDLLAMRFGPFKEEITFYVQERIETDIESGADTYYACGQYPEKVVLGYEKKGESYFATWKERSQMPEQVWGVMDKIAPVLNEYRYCNLISSEVRIKDDVSSWLDPCLRFGSPAGEEELELYQNLPEIINACANGEFKEPEMAAKFCGEAVIEYTGDKDGWKSIKVPKDVERWVKLYACAYDGDSYHMPPGQDAQAIGCAIWLDDTPEGVVDGLKDIAEQLKDSPVSLNIQPMADLFEEIGKAEEEGIPFSNKEMPDPAIVL